MPQEDEAVSLSEESSSNACTLKSYELGAGEYINRTLTQIGPSFKDWIDRTLALLPPQPRIIEIGAGFGRDAEYIESRGYSVERTDATEAFVALLQEKGHCARPFNILKDSFTNLYDLVFANAVFLHFTRQELSEVLRKVWSALKDRGILSFAVKKGQGEEWTMDKLDRPRYFCYWGEPEIVALLIHSGFEEVNISEDAKFLQIIAKKN